MGNPVQPLPTGAVPPARVFPVQKLDSIPPDTGFYCSLALDGERNALIGCWRDLETPEAALLFLRGSVSQANVEIDNYESEVVATGRGSGTALTVDPSGRPWLAWYDLDARAVKIAHRESAGWVTPPEVVEAEIASFAVAGISLAMGSDGQPRISYCTGRGLTFASRSASAGWLTPEVAPGTSGTAGVYNALALDAAGVPHISFFDLDAQTLRLARKTAAWSIVDVGPFPAGERFAGEFTGIQVDAAGVVNIAYWSLGGPRYARLAAGATAWQFEKIEEADGAGMYISLGLDRGGQPQAAYYDPRAGRLRLARRVNGQWLAETVDADGDTGGFVSLAIDVFGVAHMAYYDWGARIPRVAVTSKGPRLADDSFHTFVNRPVRADVLANDRRPDDNPLTLAASLVSQPSHGKVALTPDGAYTYTPDEGFSGIDHFRYQASDSAGVAAAANVTVTVTIPFLVQTANQALPSQTIRVGRLDLLGVQSSVRPALDVQIGSVIGATFAPLSSRVSLSDFPFEPIPASLGPGPFTIAFIAREKNYILAFTSPFVLPRHCRM